MNVTKELIHELYHRNCKDTGYKMDYIKAAIFTASVLKISPLQIWMAFPCLDVMDQVAKGTHPYCKK
jgi:hypothetical protein